MQRATHHQRPARPDQPHLPSLTHCQWYACPCKSRTSSRVTRGLAVTQAQASSTAALNYSTRIATSAAELRAAAYLRAQSFYVYPPDRSEWAARSHRRMKADAEWDSLTAKVEGREEFYKDVKVVAFVATIDDVPEQPQAQQVAVEVDPSTKLPANPEAGLQHPQVVVGTLDLNIGRTLPAEELQGKLPAFDATQGTSAARPGRAYLSNVCVATAARRQGVAQALVAAVEQYLQSLPVSYLYVHVVHDNLPALQLYQQGLGFRVESEETENFAKATSRPRRLLLCKPLK
mmetsp:Transcript_6025/g.16049  ORF Transcript_6025/g.16049 Transcript_6025/m.16049 type:complete len:289 (+) Transcript_6025:1731-2597(+)